MSSRLFPPFLLLLALVLAGCATVSQPELASLRANGVHEETLHNLEKGRPLTPPQIIELTHRGAPERLLVRHIHAWGVNYLVNREDIRQLVAARVSPRVIDALIEESRELALRYSPLPPDYGYYGPWYGGVWVGGGYGGGWRHR
jgi:hypothetical protein